MTRAVKLLDTLGFDKDLVESTSERAILYKKWEITINNKLVQLAKKANSP